MSAIEEENIKQKIEDAIRGTLVVDNKQSIPLAVEKIYKAIKDVNTTLLETKKS